MEYFNFNYYKAYIYNIHTFITKYKLHYEWLDLNNEFYLGVSNQQYYEFLNSFHNPWLDKYGKNQRGLGQDILKNGMFTPFFYTIRDNKKYIVVGKHRLYSLYVQNLYEPINKKFLFIELPNEHSFFKNISDKVIYYSDKDHFNPIMYCPKNKKEIISIILETGDGLTYYNAFNKPKQFKPFNNEEKFNKWIKEEIQYETLCLD